jgi:hypothetical protein
MNQVTHWIGILSHELQLSDTSLQTKSQKTHKKPVSKRNNWNQSTSRTPSLCRNCKIYSHIDKSWAFEMFLPSYSRKGWYGKYI